MHFASSRQNVKKTELDMIFSKYLLAGVLLTFSGQSLALFMPEGFRINTETSVVDDGGCGLISVAPALKS
jgi:hypothetical protein